jgi:hypothetical protein
VAEYGRPEQTSKAGPSQQPASPRPAALADVVARASDILAREMATRPPGAGGSASRLPLGRVPATSSAQPTLAPLDDLRRRAGDALTDLMSALGAIAGVPAGSSSNASLPWLRDQALCSPGETARVGFAFENCGERPELVTFYCTDLVGDAGHNIASYQVAFDPPSQTLAPQAQGRVAVNVGVPLQALPGCYSGLVQAVGLPATKAVITIQVR